RDADGDGGATLTDLFYFVDGDNTCRHLYRTAEPGAPAAAAAPSGFFSSADNTLQLWYLRQEGHVHELFFFVGGDNTWRHRDLTAETGAPAAAAAPSGFFSSADNTLQVLYLGREGGIAALWFFVGAVST